MKSSYSERSAGFESLTVTRSRCEPTPSEPSQWADLLEDSQITTSRIRRNRDTPTGAREARSVRTVERETTPQMNAGARGVERKDNDRDVPTRKDHKRTQSKQRRKDQTM